MSQTYSDWYFGGLAAISEPLDHANDRAQGGLSTKAHQLVNGTGEHHRAASSPVGSASMRTQQKGRIEMTTIARIAEVYTEVLANRMGNDVEVNGSTLQAELVEGLITIFRLYENDPEYLHISAIFDAPDGDISTDRVREICATATLDSKVGKAVIDKDGDLIFSVEMIVAGPDLLPSPEHLQAILPRAIQILLTIAQKTLMEIEFASEPADKA